MSPACHASLRGKSYNRYVHSNGSKYGLSEIVPAVRLRAVDRYAGASIIIHNNKRHSRKLRPNTVELGHVCLVSHNIKFLPIADHQPFINHPQTP